MSAGVNMGCGADGKGLGAVLTRGAGSGRLDGVKERF